MSAPIALVRRPGPRLAEGIVTHLDRSAVDLDLARAQWEAYAGAFTAAGWQVVEVEPASSSSQRTSSRSGCVCRRCLSSGPCT